MFSYGFEGIYSLYFKRIPRKNKANKLVSERLLTTYYGHPKQVIYKTPRASNRPKADFGGILPPTIKKPPEGGKYMEID